MGGRVSWLGVINVDSYLGRSRTAIPVGDGEEEKHLSLLLLESGSRLEGK